MEEWTLQQKIGVFGLALPLAIFMWAVIFAKIG